MGTIGIVFLTAAYQDLGKNDLSYEQYQVVLKNVNQKYFQAKNLSLREM